MTNSFTNTKKAHSYLSCGPDESCQRLAMVEGEKHSLHHLQFIIKGSAILSSNVLRLVVYQRVRNIVSIRVLPRDDGHLHTDGNTRISQTEGAEPNAIASLESPQLSSLDRYQQLGWILGRRPPTISNNRESGNQPVTLPNPLSR